MMKMVAAAKVSMRMFSRKSVQVQLSQSRMRWCIRPNPGSQMELCARMHYVYVCVSQLQIMCPHELHLVLMHIVYCLVWMHNVYCQWCGCTNMIARRPYMGRD